MAQRLHADVHTVDANAVTVDGAGGLLFRKRRQAGLQQRAKVTLEFVPVRCAVKVVDVDHIDARKPEAVPTISQ